MTDKPEPDELQAILNMFPAFQGKAMQTWEIRDIGNGWVEIRLPGQDKWSAMPWSVARALATAILAQPSTP